MERILRGLRQRIKAVKEILRKEKQFYKVEEKENYTKRIKRRKFRNGWKEKKRNRVKEGKY